MTANTYTIRDPFAGEIDVDGESLEAAISDAYRDIDPSERPAYVWHDGERVSVPGGTLEPTQ